MGKKCIGLWKVTFKEGGEAERHYKLRDIVYK
jgi:hypothetical protein